MQDPIKIIYKYNNNKRVTKYGIHIFIGKNIDNETISILDEIKDISFIETLITLNEKKYKKMENIYGKFWYTKFFNTYHMSLCFEIIKTKDEYNKKITEKYGNEWIVEHCNIYNLFNTTIRYEYGKIIEKLYRKKKIHDDEIDINLLFQEEKNINNTITKKKIQSGGNLDNIENEELYENMMESEIDEIYKEIDNIDVNIKETTKDIKKILLNDDKLNNIGTDNFNENDMEDMEPNVLENIYKKTYITTQYIYKDDTIKNIKNKICCSIKNSKKYGIYNYIIPSRQYLWIEYLYDNMIKKLMLEFKWIYRNKLLLLDVEPNNLDVYENMKNNLKILKTHVKVDKFSRTYDENNILYDYEKYMSNNEIYMIDVYNELGMNYKPDNITYDNVLSTYISLYFPIIKNEASDFQNIIDYLNDKKEKEETLIQKVIATINNDLIVENMIMDQVEQYKIKDKTKYEYLFTEKYIINTIICIDLQSSIPINLYHIFTYFTLNDKYIMIQYKKQDGNNIINIHKPSTKNLLENVIENNENNSGKIDINVLQHAKNGLNFKIYMKFEKITKIITINLRENGKIEYTIAWKEYEEATFSKISKTYDMVIELINKLNNECNKCNFVIPKYDDFYYKFIYVMQNFKLPKDEIIDHNNLSKLCGYFYPYVSLIINPRKRGSNLNTKEEKGKFGTYLKYKRISKYDNKREMRKRILFIMKNYEYTNKKLVEQITKEFNILEKQAQDEINNINQKNIKKSRKILKKMEDITKQKLLGISIEIQGKTADKYKMRISGTKSVEQLDRILIFLNIVLFVYVEIYIHKDPEKLEFKKKLEQLKDIATRRHKIDVIYNYKTEKNSLKSMIAYDKKRLGYVPEEGQSSWIRSCQNSGKQIRHPKDYKSNELDVIMKNGYVFNEKTNVFEKKVKMNNNSIVLKVVKVYDFDKNGNPTDHFVYYTCDPKINGKYIHIGFLTKSKNPNNIPLPCCFIKDQQHSKNENIRKYYENAISIKKQENFDNSVKNILYILQDTNKLSPGKLCILPIYLDYYLNGLMMKSKIINKNILISAENGYFFKYGILTKYNSFIDSICYVFNISFDTIFLNIKKILENDNDSSIFTSLKNGDIKTKYKTHQEYINFLSSELYKHHDDIEDIFSIPGIVSKNKLQFVIFERNKKNEVDDISINHNDHDDIYKLEHIDCDYMIILKENYLYNPIIMMTKKKNKEFTLTNIFKYSNDDKNIVNHICKYYKESCKNYMQLDIPKISIKQMSYLINNQIPDFSIHKQYIDSKNKCTFGIIKYQKDFFIIPTKPSGSMYNIPIIFNLNKYYKKYDETLFYLNLIYEKSKEQISVKPMGFYYDYVKHENGEEIYNIVSVVTILHEYVPIVPTLIKKTDIDINMNLEKQPLYSTLDEYIKKNDFVDINGENIINFSLYIENGYQIFKYHMSGLINNKINIRNNIINTLNDDSILQKNKTQIIGILIYNIIGKNLLQKYIENNNIDEKSLKIKNNEKIEDSESFLDIQQNNDDFDKTNISKFKIDPILHKCNEYDTETCEKNIFCKIIEDKCKLSIPIKLVILFTNKFISELINNDYKTKEILNLDGYILSDIVDETYFIEKTNEKIIIIEPHKNSMEIIKNVFQNMDQFINKKIQKNSKNLNMTINTHNKENIDNPLKKLETHYMQKINMNNGIFNAYANSYYWLKHKYYNIKNRNLGYISITQINIANYIKGEVIKWLLNKNNTRDALYILNYDNKNNFSTNNMDYGIQQYILSIHKSKDITNGIIELYILNKIFNLYKIILYNEEQIIYIFDDGIKYDFYDKNLQNYDIDIKNYNDVICLQFDFKLNKKYAKPENIYVIYHK